MPAARAARLAACLAGAALAAALAPAGARAQTLRVNDAVAGQPPTPVVFDGTYSLGNSPLLGCPFRIVASVSANMPAGTTLTLSLTGPAGTTSLGPQVLTTTPTTMVTGVGCVTGVNNAALRYTLSATTASGVRAASTRTVTIQITQ
jgi:hypothetical protein